MAMANLTPWLGLGGGGTGDVGDRLVEPEDEVNAGKANQREQKRSPVHGNINFSATSSLMYMCSDILHLSEQYLPLGF